MSKNRLDWISGAKFVAIMAVVIVHCNGIMYDSLYIASSTSFSVTLFILLSGLGSYLSYQRNPDINFGKSLLKLIPILKSYGLATVILYFLYKRQFVPANLLKHLLFFDVEPTFYFVFFFLQLKLISPFLVKWYGFCDSKNNKALLHIFTLIAMLAVSSVCINYTHTLPLYGGGKHLFGGSYLFVYYLGIVSGPVCRLKPDKKQLLLTLFLSSAGWFVWSLALFNQKLPFDRWLQPFLGAGDNPPSVNYTVFAILTMFVCYGAFQLISGIDIKPVKLIVSICVWLGNNTMEIFLYHFAIMKLSLEFLPVLATNIWLLRLVVFPSMVLLAPSIKYIIKIIMGKKTVKQSIAVK